MSLAALKIDSRIDQRIADIADDIQQQANQGKIYSVPNMTG